MEKRSPLLRATTLLAARNNREACIYRAHVHTYVPTRSSLVTTPLFLPRVSFSLRNDHFPMINSIELGRCVSSFSKRRFGIDYYPATVTTSINKTSRLITISRRNTVIIGFPPIEMHRRSSVPPVAALRSMKSLRRCSPFEISENDIYFQHTGTVERIEIFHREFPPRLVDVNFSPRTVDTLIQPGYRYCYP